MIMGRNKRTNFQDNGADSDTEAMSIPKKSKKAVPEPAARINKFSNSVNPPQRNVRKCRGQNIYTDSSSCSESDNEKNSVKKSERSVSNSDSDSGSESDSSGSDSSRGSKSVPNSVTNPNPVEAEERYEEEAAKSSGSDSYHSDTEEEDKKRRRKQKEIMKQQLNKKSKRVIPRKQESLSSKRDAKEEIEEEVKDHDDDRAEGQGNAGAGVDRLNWPESDVLELIRRMEVQIPDGDTQKFDSRAARLDWNKIAFGNYSKQECQDTWIQISKRIRRFRKLSEVLEDAKEWAKKPWTNFYKGTKGNRHPDMPPKALSPYVIFYLEQKDKTMAENKGADLVQISKIITEKYKKLSDKEREKYSQKAAKEKRNFEKKISEFYKVHPECQTSTQSKVNSRESLKGPQKPHPPFKLFFQGELKNINVDGVTEKKLAEEVAREKWKSFSDKKKAEWIKMSLDDLSRYEREVKAFQQKNPDYTVGNYNKNLLNKEERLIMARLSGKPVKPPNSAYSLFSRYMLQSDKDMKSIAPKLRMAEISKKWKELSTTEKHKYELNVKELQEDYQSKLQKYIESLTPEEREREWDLMNKEKKRKKERLTKGALKSQEANSKKGKKNFRLYVNEPKPPPINLYDFFVKKFLADRPFGVSEETRLKQAQESWAKLPDSKRDALEEELALAKEKYVIAFSKFLKSLSKQQLKDLVARKSTAKKEEAEMQRMNGTLTDSNDESEEAKYESSSDGSDSDGSDSGKSKRNGSESGRSKTSSSEDSDG